MWNANLFFLSWRCDGRRFLCIVSELNQFLKRRAIVQGYLLYVIQYNPAKRHSGMGTSAL